MEEYEEEIIITTTTTEEQVSFMHSNVTLISHGSHEQSQDLIYQDQLAIDSKESNLSFETIALDSNQLLPVSFPLNPSNSSVSTLVGYEMAHRPISPIPEITDDRSLDTFLSAHEHRSLSIVPEETDSLSIAHSISPQSVPVSPELDVHDAFFSTQESESLNLIADEEMVTSSWISDASPRLNTSVATIKKRAVRLLSNPSSPDVSFSEPNSDTLFSPMTSFSSLLRLKASDHENESPLVEEIASTVETHALPLIDFGSEVIEPKTELKKSPSQISLPGSLPGVLDEVLERDIVVAPVIVEPASATEIIELKGDEKGMPTKVLDSLRSYASTFFNFGGDSKPAGTF